MTDNFVQVYGGGNGLKVDTSELAVGNNTVERQRINISDATTVNAHANVVSSAPAVNAVGLVVREAAQGQQLSVNSHPVVIASDQSVLSVVIATANATAKGVQGANAQPVQNLLDAGRTYVSLLLDGVTTITAEALATMTINQGGTVTSSTVFQVPAGKAFRIQTLSASIKGTSSTGVYGKIRVRAGATVSVSSGIVLNADLPIPLGSLVAGAGYSIVMGVPDGLEIPAGQQVGISHIENSTLGTASVCLTGFLY